MIRCPQKDTGPNVIHDRTLVYEPMVPLFQPSKNRVGHKAEKSSHFLLSYVVEDGRSCIPGGSIATSSGSIEDTTVAIIFDSLFSESKNVDDFSTLTGENKCHHRSRFDEETFLSIRMSFISISRSIGNVA